MVIAADHGGLQLKEGVLDWIRQGGFDLTDLGAYEFIACDDYPDYALMLAREIISGRAERGILICGSGVGAACAANKIPSIRAGLCHDSYSAHQGVEHDDMNVLCLGGRVIGAELARDLIRIFLNAQFDDKERYRRRVAKMTLLENHAQTED